MLMVQNEIDLRFGRWQDVLVDVECDLLCVDAPYSARTHEGHDSSAGDADRAARWAESRGENAAARRTINYQAWTEPDVARFVNAWHPRTRGWFVTITDHALARAWESELERVGRYVFSPLAFVASGSRVRLAGDGP